MRKHNIPIITGHAKRPPKMEPKRDTKTGPKRAPETSSFRSPREPKTLCFPTVSAQKDPRQGPQKWLPKGSPKGIQKEPEMTPEWWQTMELNWKNDYHKIMKREISWNRHLARPYSFKPAGVANNWIERMNHFLSDFPFLQRRGGRPELLVEIGLKEIL